MTSNKTILMICTGALLAGCLMVQPVMALQCDPQLLAAILSDPYSTPAVQQVAMQTIQRCQERDDPRIQAQIQLDRAKAAHINKLANQPTMGPIPAGYMLDPNNPNRLMPVPGGPYDKSAKQ